MSTIIVNTTNEQYVRVTNNKGLVGIGGPYTINPENGNEIIVTLNSIQNKRSLILERLNKTVDANAGELRSTYGYGGGDNQEDVLVRQFKKFLRDVLYQSPVNPPPDAVGDAVLTFFPYSSQPFKKIGEARDYIISIMGDWVRLFDDIINKKTGLAREPIPPTPTPSRPPAPTPLPTWRNCITGQMVQALIPTDGWIQSLYNGPEGGFCREPVFISIASSSAPAFSYSTTAQGNIQNTYTFTNTAPISASYAINFATDPAFTINPNSIRLAQNEQKTVVITLPSENLNKFLLGTSNFRLQMNVVKL